MMVKKSLLFYRILIVFAFLFYIYFIFQLWAGEKATLITSIGLVTSAMIFNVLYEFMWLKVKSKHRRFLVYIFYIGIQVIIFFFSQHNFFEIAGTDEVINNNYWYFGMKFCFVVAWTMILRATFNYYKSID